MRSPRISRSLCRRWGNCCPMNRPVLCCTVLPVVAEPVIEVPKIFLGQDSAALGGLICARRRWWNSWCMCTTDRVLFFAPRSLLPSRSSTFQFRVTDGGGARGWSTAVLSQDRISAALHVEQPVDIPVPQGRGGVGARDGLQGFLSRQGSTVSSSSSHVGAADVR